MFASLVAANINYLYILVNEYLDSTVYRDKKILKYSLTDVEIWAQ
jgi:hypothetical protein